MMQKRIYWHTLTIQMCWNTQTNVYKTQAIYAQALDLIEKGRKYCYTAAIQLLR